MQRTPDKQELSQALLLSISQYSWDKQIRLTTDEDVLCSYSKFSNDQGSYSENRRDQVFLKKCTQIQDSQETKQLLQILREKDKKIEELEQYQLWLQEQNEKLKLNQQMMIEEQSMNQQNDESKQLKQIEDLEQQIIQTEQQLHKSMKSLGQLEKDNANLKAKLFECEQKLFSQQHQHKQTEQQNEVIVQVIKQLKQNQLDQEQNYNSKLFELQQYIKSQDQYINKLQNDVSISRKNSKENIGKQYKSVVLREKSPQLTHYDPHQMTKFVECIVDMVMNCTLSQSKPKPSLKECWKWLKNILEEYMILKKSMINDIGKAHSTKSSQFVGKELNGDRKRDHSFFNDLNRRFQTSVEDSENKYLRSNTLLSRAQK